MPGYTLDAESIQKLEDALLKLGQLDPLIFDTVTRRWFNSPPPTWQIVKVTSTTLDSNGCYPAIVEYWRPRLQTWFDDKSPCKLLPANGETLTLGVRYLARATERELGLTGEVVWVTMCCECLVVWGFAFYNITFSSSSYNNVTRPRGIAAIYNALRATTTTVGGSNVSGFTKGNDGEVFELLNEGPRNLTLNYDSSSSSSGNKIFTPTLMDKTLVPNESVLLKYDVTQDSGDGGWVIAEQQATAAVLGYGTPSATAPPGTLYLDTSVAGYALYVSNGLGSWSSLSLRDMLSSQAYVEGLITGTVTLSAIGVWNKVQGTGPYTITLNSGMGIFFKGGFCGLRMDYSLTGTITIVDSNGRFSLTRVAGQMATFFFDGTDWFINSASP
jgi:hypothetical protein